MVASLHPFAQVDGEAVGKNARGWIARIARKVLQTFGMAELIKGHTQVTDPFRRLPTQPVPISRTHHRLGLMEEFLKEGHSLPGKFGIRRPEKKQLKIGVNPHWGTPIDFPPEFIPSEFLLRRLAFAQRHALFQLVDGLGLRPLLLFHTLPFYCNVVPMRAQRNHIIP